MILSRIWAGLGNQLFQYAAGRCLAILHQTLLKLDTRWYGMKIPGDTPRRYELDHFRIRAEKATKTEIQKFPFAIIPTSKLGRSFLPRWQLFLQEKASYPSLRTYREPHFHFDSKFFDLSSPIYLIGYFQSERYFKPIEESLREEFSFKLHPSKENQQFLDHIRKTSSVSLHVRRGDYALNQRIHRHHGLCSLSYYKQAMQEIKKRVYAPHFYVFSDDIPWVQEHLPMGQNVTYVSHNQKENSYEDLRLMSHCSHHILANSSFSWWGAWLNPRNDKIVVAPRQWTCIPLNISDLLPSEWILL